MYEQYHGWSYEVYVAVAGHQQSEAVNSRLRLLAVVPLPYLLAKRLTSQAVAL